MTYRLDSWQFACTHNVQGICWSWDRRADAPRPSGRKPAKAHAADVPERDSHEQQGAA